MGSIDSEKPLTKGTFMVPVFDGEPHSDPYTRAYMAPPKPNRIADINFPLIDFRDQVFNCASGGDYTKDAAFMASHGFTAVKHNSSILDSTGFQNPETISTIYYREIEELVKQVTGCKTVVVTYSTCRGGPAPAHVDDHTAFKPNATDTKLDMTQNWHKPKMAQPVRLPHCDSTALGGRQSLRVWQRNLTDIANTAGIITTEDEIGARNNISATKKSDRSVFEEQYDGPRYASYSIWRPMKPVTRDPLAMVPWSSAKERKDLVIEPYDNRNQGFDGDWTRELAMLKILPEAVEAGSSDLSWYYVEKMLPDEVLFVKFFDTAGLGKDAGEEVGCLHGSPDLGEDGFGEHRESVEVRCFAFW